MIYAVSDEGIQSLRGMAQAILSARDEISGHAQKLKTVGDGQGLSPHAESIVFAGEAIERALNSAANPLEEIAETLNDVADSYEEIIENDRIRSTIGNLTNIASNIGSGTGANQLNGSYEVYRDEIMEKNPGMSEETAKALYTNVKDRTARQVELADSARYIQYESQVSFATDPKTGKILLDENGNLVRTRYGAANSQRPDGVRIDENGNYDLREQKSYHNVSSLMQNIKAQAKKRRAGFGDDINITFVLAENLFTVRDAERLIELSEQLGVNIEWQRK